MHPDAATGRSGRFRFPDHVAVPALGSLFLAVLFIAVLLGRADGDLSMLVHAGPPWTDAATAPDSLTVQNADAAFDGQFFYRLGVDPRSTDETVAGVTFDLPALRNARWGYGAAAWAVSGADPDLVPAALVLVNLAAATALGVVGGLLARSAGRSAAWGLLFALWPGFAYSLSLDTSELLASALVLGGLLAARRRSWAAAAALLTFAVLTRDTTAVVPFGFAVAGVIGRWRTRSAPADEPARPDRDEPEHAPGPASRLGIFMTGAVPLAVFGGWQLLQLARFGELPLTSSGDNNLSAPLVGFVRLLRSALTEPGGTSLFRAASAIGLIALIALAALHHRRRPGPRAEHIARIGAIAVVLVLNTYLWSGATAFMRAGTEAGILSILALLPPAPLRRPSPAVPGSPRSPGSGWASGTTVLPLVAAALGTGWLVTAAMQIAKLG